MAAVAAMPVGDEVKKEKKEKKVKDEGEKAEKKEKKEGKKDKQEGKEDKADKKEKKEKKDKESKEDNGEKKEKKEKKDKDKDGEKKEKKDKKEDKEAGEKKERVAPSRPGAPPPPPFRTPPTIQQPVRKGPIVNDYLAGVDLPSSESEDEGYERSARADQDVAVHFVAASSRETRKLADKERKASEKAFMARKEALKEDENVFDVSYEGQGDESVVSSATDVKVQNLTIRAKGKLLLENCAFTIAAGRRYGLVGPNGRGKSTLLRLLAMRQLPVPDTLDVLLVEQEVVGTDLTALEAVVAADVELMELRAEEVELLGRLENPETASKEHDSDADQDRLNEIYERMRVVGASTAESRASKILHGLGFTEAMQKRATQMFSGGWRMRISLARALYIQPTLLLLDEPTNHLDLRAVLWLEEYLQRWKKTLVVVSHDREFLNSITTDIIHLHDNKLHQYRGNFASFEEMYEQRRREANNVFDKFAKQLKAAKISGKNSKINQEKIRDVAAKNVAKKNKNAAVDDAGSSTAGVNQPQKWSDYSVEFHFPAPTELPPPLIQVLDVDFKYPDREDFGLQQVNIGMDMGDRLVIVGPNGAGKTTFMNLMSGDLVPTAGETRRHQKLRIGRYAQHFVDALVMDVNPVEYLLEKFPEAGLRPEGMRAKLGRFGLEGTHHLTPICKLSGGQKARVVFTAISLHQPHILLLDEPTNHLDMQSIDALCDALEEFQGGIVVISHDAQLLSRLCADEERSQVLVVEDGNIRKYPGDFDDYRSELIREIQKELDEE